MSHRGCLKDLDGLSDPATAAGTDSLVPEDFFVAAMLESGDLDVSSAAHMFKHVAQTAQRHAESSLQLRLGGSYCGDKGARALLQPLARDFLCSKLDLSTCGLHNQTVQELTEVLSRHQVRSRRLALVACW